MLRHTILILFPLIVCVVYPVQTQMFQKFIHYLDSLGGCNIWLPKLVTVKQGTIRGSTLYSGKGEPFCSFQGIPYSQPPIGEYRFKEPRPPKPWTGVLDGTKDNPDCLHVKAASPNTEGKEDCLYLSVFTPRRKPVGEKLLDVMVWIFPGEFYFGSSSMKKAGPHFFMDKDVILVYPSYRVGTLGFLSTGDDESPGNYGLKDQVAALHWIKENIQAFGGNCSSITLLGHSSGASSAHLHMMSPLAKGLFHRAISMEGTAINPWARSPNPLRQAQKQGDVFNCPTEPSSSLVACLREVNAVDLVKSIYHLMEWWILPGSGFTPVVENKTNQNPNPYITVEPLELMRNGEIKNVPWLVGGTNAGFSIVTYAPTTVKLLHDQLKEHTEIIKEKLLLLNVSVPQNLVADVASKVLDYYGGPKNLDPELLTKMLTDRLLLHSIHKSVQLEAQKNNKIFYYNFAYKSVPSFSLGFTLKNVGTAHGDELFYLFKSPAGIPNPASNNDLEVRDLMLSMWTNFAKYGDPTPNNKTENYLINEMKWFPVRHMTADNLHMNYLNIDQVIEVSGLNEYLNVGLGPVKLNMDEDLSEERMAFWDSLPLNENCIINCDKS